MEINDILALFEDVLPPKPDRIERIKHEEGDGEYQVWRIDAGGSKYILKEAKGFERELYSSVLPKLGASVPAVYGVRDAGEKTYLLMELIEGEDLERCRRGTLTAALDALIDIQRSTWEDAALSGCGLTFEESLRRRKNRGEYLKDALLEEAYGKFLDAYCATPRALCHDDLLPFNVIVSGGRGVLIDWETAGLLPYPVPFARLIAHGEEDENALFYMKRADRDFAVSYYYEKLLRDKDISRAEWERTLELFLFYEYCEWVYVGNKFNETDGVYYKKYLPAARKWAEKILSSKYRP